MKSHVKLSFYPCINYMLIFNITSHQQYLKIRYLKSNWHSTNACKEKAKPLNMWRKGHSLPCKSVATRSWQGGCWVMSCEKKIIRKTAAQRKFQVPQNQNYAYVNSQVEGGIHRHASEELKNHHECLCLKPWASCKKSELYIFQLQEAEDLGSLLHFAEMKKKY